MKRTKMEKQPIYRVGGGVTVADSILTPSGIDDLAPFNAM